MVMKIFILLLLASNVLHAKVQIVPYKKYSWDNSWNESIAEILEREENSLMLTDSLDADDLKELHCPGFNTAVEKEAKKDFWIVFLSSLTRAESAFNPKARAIAPRGGHGNYGLVQLSKRTAREQCGLKTMEDIANPNLHLGCGVKLLSWQIKGAPTPNGKKLLRPDLKGQLFGKRILLWGPLRQNDKSGRALLITWFKKHLDQLPFCRP